MGYRNAWESCHNPSPANMWHHELEGLVLVAEMGAELVAELLLGGDELTLLFDDELALLFDDVELELGFFSLLLFLLSHLVDWVSELVDQLYQLQYTYIHMQYKGHVKN